ncbi:hypothetical protein ScPMuIL_018560 [Solemya velum]
MDKKVPTLLTNEMVHAIDTLNQYRSDCGIKETNKYIFANQENGHLESWQALKRVAKEAECKKPELINSVSLKNTLLLGGAVAFKPSSTHSQDAQRLLQTPRSCCGDWQSLQTSVASRNGEIAKYSGQSLEDIDIDDSVAFEADEENIGEEDFLDEELSDLSGQNSVAFEADEDIVGEENFLDEQLSDLSGQTSESSRCERQLLPVTYRQSDDELDDSDADPVFDPESDSATETTEQPPQKGKEMD